jgi:hypothetical protein
MAIVHVPPADLRRGTDIPFCINFVGDPLFIEFDQSAYMIHVTGFFAPELPTGLFSQGDIIGPYKPLIDNTEMMIHFLCTQTNEFYRYTIQIKDDCTSK